ncbi:hypothetical protein KPH14_006840 [Odynerus spinipes]|uniref:Uncharacterized protein n=1 Tax=Odynerus spinipes TaxID=1348599 RepID=A0AAD9VSI4_9HYME|nr:hypothetical protein KPH14_006840 [Odynerus spinipes]
MKGFYLILCACFAVFITIESKEAVKKYTETLSNEHADRNVCRNASGITTEFIENLNKTEEELEAPEMEETRHKVGCYISCLMQEKEIMSGSEIQVQKIIDMLKSLMDSNEKASQETVNIITGVVQDCGKQVENMTNACEIGWKFGKCTGKILAF